MLEFVQVPIGRGGIAPCRECARLAQTHERSSPRRAVEVAADARGDATRLARAADGSPAPGPGARPGPASGPGPNLVFTGFEPFAHPELPQLVGSAVDAGYERIRLRTDAGALAREGNAEGALHAGVRHFEIVVLGSRETHDRLTGRPGLFDAARAGASSVFAQAERLGVDIFVSGLVPVCRHNATVLAEAVASLASLGAAAVVIDTASHLPTLVELQPALDTAAVNAVAASVSSSDRTPMPWRLVELVR